MKLLPQDSSQNLSQSMRICALWLLSISLILGFSSTAISETAATLEFKHCQIQQQATKIDAECATLIRPEDLAKPEARQIELSVARLAATTPNPTSDAFTIIQGGPGGSSIDLAISLSQVIEMIRRDRDVLLVDQRGTGRSKQLSCDTPDNISELDPKVIAELTTACASQLSNSSDLKHYTTSVAVQDLDAVRAAAGYSQLSIYGVSYGTRVAQHYLRRFPEQTRLLIIDGVVDVGLNLAGSEIALRSQAAFDNVVARCAASTACTEEFGDIKSKFESVHRRLKEAPVTIQTRHPQTGKATEVSIGDNELLISVRLMPYATETVSLLPLLIQQAYVGDYGLLAAYSQIASESLQETLAIGMHNSVMCSEDEPFLDYENLTSAAHTYFGDEAADLMKTTCAIWPQGLIDDDFQEPFASDKPILVLSGETDPITPPSNGERAANMFSNSRHIIVPAHGHGVVARGCMPFLVQEFLQSGDLESLNTQCIERERATPFFTSSSGPKP